MFRGKPGSDSFGCSVGWGTTISFAGHASSESPITASAFGLSRRCVKEVHMLAAEQFGALAGDDVNEGNGIERVLPMRDHERVGLVVEIKILT